MRGVSYQPHPLLLCSSSEVSAVSLSSPFGPEERQCSSWSGRNLTWKESLGLKGKKLTSVYENIWLGEFPGGPVVRTQHFHYRTWVQSLVRELRSWKPYRVQPKNNFFLANPTKPILNTDFQEAQCAVLEVQKQGAHISPSNGQFLECKWSFSELTEIFNSYPNQCDQHKDALSPQVSVGSYFLGREKTKSGLKGENADFQSGCPSF